MTDAQQDITSVAQGSLSEASRLAPTSGGPDLVTTVTVPSDPPDFNPAAARALLRLLLAVHRTRHIEERPRGET